METIVYLDQQLFLLLNSFPHTFIWNIFFETISGSGTFGMTWIGFCIGMFVREEKKRWWYFVPISIALSLSYLTSSFLLKPLFARPRPEFFEMVRVGLVPGDASFPSTHATTSFAAAYILSKMEPRATVVSYTVAILISYSRIYLGMHYPSDIIGGMILGLCIGWISWKGCRESLRNEQ